MRNQWYFEWGGHWYSCDRDEAISQYRDGYKIGVMSGGTFKMLSPRNRERATRAA